MEKYPYFIYPDLKKLKQASLSEKERRILNARIIANMGNRQSVEKLLGINQLEFVRDFSVMKSKDSKSGFDTIEAFLDKFPGKIAGPSVEIGVPVPKNNETVTKDSEKRESSHSGFIKKDQKFLELVKNKKYNDAIAFLEAENLNNPEKNIYFATQIRFLKKLQEIHDSKFKRKQEH